MATQPHATEIKIGEAEINARRAHYTAKCIGQIYRYCAAP
jgi:hypothetical protein